MRVGLDERNGRWIVVYDDRASSRPPESRYAFVPISPVGYPGWAIVESGRVVWRLFEVLWERRDPPLASSSGGPSEASIGKHVQGDPYWLSPMEQSRIVFPLTEIATGERKKLTLSIDGRFGVFGLSRDDAPPTDARVWPLEFLFQL